MGRGILFLGFLRLKKDLQLSWVAFYSVGCHPWHMVTSKAVGRPSDQRAEMVCPWELAERRPSAPVGHDWAEFGVP